MLTDSQIERYSRQIILQPVGGRGQEALLCAAVAVVGDHEAAGTALVYLAAAGVGRLTRVTSHPGTDRVNPDTELSERPMPQRPAEYEALVSGHAVVVALQDLAGMDALHDAGCATGTPLLWGVSAGPRGWAARLGDSPGHACPGCLNAIIRDAGRPSGGPSLAPIAAAFLGTALASEALKSLLGLPDSLAGRYLVHDGTAGTVVCHVLAPVPSCPVCSGTPADVRVMDD